MQKQLIKVGGLKSSLIFYREKNKHNETKSYLRHYL